jgi:predicted MFS family arabinose efflux permease
MFLAMFVGSGFVMLSVCWATRVYSADHSGLIAGIGAGSWGASVALSMPIFGRLFDQHRYGEAFVLSTVLPAVGYALWYWLAGRETEAKAAAAVTSRA